MTSETEPFAERKAVPASAGQRESRVLPDEFLEWQSTSRADLFRTFVSGGSGRVKAMPAHLAVLGSHGHDGSINLAMKGIGLVPVPEKLQAFTSLFRRTIDRSLESEWEATLRERMETLLSFYRDTNHIDDTRLGGLEIFDGSTYSNLREDPRASLLFSGEAPVFKSYQVDGIVEFVRRPNQYYNFLLAAREMFGRDSFHVPQKAYRRGFVMHVTQVKDKRPFTRV